MTTFVADFATKPPFRSALYPAVREMINITYGLSSSSHDIDSMPLITRIHPQYQRLIWKQKRRFKMREALLFVEETIQEELQAMEGTLTQEPPPHAHDQPTFTPSTISHQSPDHPIPIPMNEHVITAIPTQPSSNARLMLTESTVSNPSTISLKSTSSVLLDPGSSLSMIRRDLAVRLRLQPVSKCTLKITGLNGVSEGLKDYDVVQMTLNSTNGPLSIEVIVIDKPITAKFFVGRQSKEDAAYVLSKRLHLPHHPQCSHLIELDILLGIDDSLSILHSSKKTRLPSGLYLIETSIGNIVSGRSLPATSQTEPSTHTLTANHNCSTPSNSHHSTNQIHTTSRSQPIRAPFRQGVHTEPRPIKIPSLLDLDIPPIPFAFPNFIPPPHSRPIITQPLPLLSLQSLPINAINRPSFNLQNPPIYDHCPLPRLTRIKSLFSSIAHQRRQSIPFPLF